MKIKAKHSRIINTFLGSAYGCIHEYVYVYHTQLRSRVSGLRDEQRGCERTCFPVYVYVYVCVSFLRVNADT